MDETEVTVAIPTYNRAGLLKDALASTLGQDYPNLRVIVVDNASSDNTEAVVRSFGDSRVAYVRNDTNLGPTRNLNRAIELNSSPYLNVLMDDDILLPGFVSESVKILEEHRDVAFSFTAARYVAIDRVPLGIQHTQDMPAGVIDGLSYLELHISGRQCWIEPSTVMIRSAELANVNPFDSHHSKNVDDMHLWFQL